MPGMVERWMVVMLFELVAKCGVEWFGFLALLVGWKSRWDVKCGVGYPPIKIALVSRGRTSELHLDLHFTFSITFNDNESFRLPPSSRDTISIVGFNALG